MLEKRIDAEISRVNKNKEYEEYLKKITQANISPENIYLFIKGHKIFDLLVAVFEKISKKYKAAAHDRARKKYSNPKSEINSINNRWQNYGTLIFGSFCIVDVDVAFFSTTRLRLERIYA